MKPSLKYTLLFLALALTATVLVSNIVENKSDRKLSQEDFEMLNDYSSKLYENIEPSDLGMTKDELFDLMHITKAEESEYDFSFYKLEYAGLNEIHANGLNAENNCFNVAIINAHRYLNNTNEASFLYFQSSDPVEETHSCEGDPCESCQFVRDDDGNITGCDCSYLGGHCNHTVTSG